MARGAVTMEDWPTPTSISAESSEARSPVAVAAVGAGAAAALRLMSPAERNPAERMEVNIGLARYRLLRRLGSTIRPSSPNC